MCHFDSLLFTSVFTKAVRHPHLFPEGGGRAPCKDTTGAADVKQPLEEGVLMSAVVEEERPPLFACLFVRLSLMLLFFCGAICIVCRQLTRHMSDSVLSLSPRGVCV